MSLTIEEAETRLAHEMFTSDSESYHALFDEILEERLRELDPEFMTKMQNIYDRSGMARWYA